MLFTPVKKKKKEILINRKALSLILEPYALLHYYRLMFRELGRRGEADKSVGGSSVKRRSSNSLNSRCLLFWKIPHECCPHCNARGSPARGLWSGALVMTWMNSFVAPLRNRRKTWRGGSPAAGSYNSICRITSSQTHSCFLITTLACETWRGFTCDLCSGGDYQSFHMICFVKYAEAAVAWGSRTWHGDALVLDPHQQGQWSVCVCVCVCLKDTKNATFF